MYARLVAGVLLACSASLGLLTAAPAGAGTDDRIRVTDVTVPGPGRLTAEVRSRLPLVGTEVLDADGRRVGAWQQLDFEGRTASVDLATWGLEPDADYVLRVSNCPRWRGDCGTTDVPFTAEDVEPTITFSEDRHLTGEEQGTVTVDHPHGGGTWYALVDGYSRPLTVGETSVLPLHTADPEVVVRQCGLTCRQVGGATTFVVDKGGDVTASSEDRAVHPDDSGAPDTDVVLHTGVTGPLHFEGEVRTSSDRVVTSHPVSVDISGDAAGTAVLPIDLTTSPDGYTHLLGQLSHDGVDGPVSRWVLTAAVADVDRVAPAFDVLDLDRRTLFPHRDSYRDRVTISGRQTIETASSARDRHTVSFIPRIAGPTVTRLLRDEAGTEVFTWDGRIGEDLAPEGRYDVRVDSLDDAGHSSSVSLGSLRLDHRRLTPVRRTFTVGAEASMYHRVGGRCARVRLGAPGWDGGLSYRVGSCQSAASAISSHRTRRVPDGWVRGRLSFATYGRGADGYRSTEGARTALLNHRGYPVQRTGLGRAPGWYDSRTFDSSRLLDRRDRLRWWVFAGYDTRHDVRAFRLTYDGLALR